MDASLLIVVLDNHDLGTKCCRRGVHPIGFQNCTPKNSHRTVGDGRPDEAALNLLYLGIKNPGLR